MTSEQPLYSSQDRAEPAACHHHRRPLTVVLTWYDYPSDVAAASALVNDLDLVVELGGRRLRGNNLEDDRECERARHERKG